MPSRPFPFIDDTFDVADNPNESKPTRDNPRFPLIPPKPNASDDAFTRSGQKFAERLVEATNAGTPEQEHIDIDDVPTGLVRAFEAADASPGQNVSYLAQGTLKASSTGDGELYLVEVLLNPMAVCPDPMNGRTMIDTILQGRKLLTPTGDAPGLELPLFELDSASELIEMVDASTAELGFSGQVAPGKDYQDLISVGLQGVHEQILVIPTCYRTPDGNEAWFLVALDGNRRLAMTMRALHEASGLSSNELAAWRRHLFTAGGATLTSLDAQGVNAVRRIAQFGDQQGGTMYPSSPGDADVVDFLSGPAERSMRLRTLMRCRSIRAQLVLGVNPETVSPALAAEPSRASALVQRIVRRRHIEEAAQKPWSSDAQNMQVATSALRRVEARILEGADYVPLTVDEISRVINSEVVRWPTAPDDPNHPLRIAAKVLATLVCDDHDGTSVVKEEMKAFNIPVSRGKIAERRASLATERVMPILGFSDPAKARYKQARTVIDRTVRSRAFTDCARHPNPTEPWWSLIDLPVEDLKVRATEERAHAAATGSADDQGAGAWGPATRALVLLALLASAASPGLADGRSNASPFIITINGLGGTRGVSKTTPDHVMFRLANHDGGPEQLGEIVGAGTSTPPVPPKNIIDPTAEVSGDPSTRGYLTEHFLRSEAMGWRSGEDEGLGGDDDDEPEDYQSPFQQYQGWVASFTDLLNQVAQTAEVVTNGDDEMKREFQSHGLIGEEIQQALHVINDVVNRGRIFAEMYTE